MSERSFNVGLFLPPAHFFAATVVHGLGRFFATRQGWRLTIASRQDPNYVRRFLKGCAGAIADGSSPVLGQLRASRLPVVNYLSTHPGEAVAAVLPDEFQIGVIGAEHLLSRGYRSFGFFGMTGEWSESRQRGFVARIAAAGFPCQTTWRRRPPRWELAEDPAFHRRWLRLFQPPAAVMAMNDHTACLLIDGCRQLGWRVPEDIAVLGVNNDEFFCEYADIPLSSIDRNLDRIGYEAGGLLERLIKGEASPQTRLLVPPGPLVVRRSTAAIAINDPDVAAAARLIDEQSAYGIQVRDVLAAVPVSRRAMERKMRLALGQTPAQHIRQTRLDRARQLLKETDLPLADIAERTGFRYRTHLSMAFKRTFGQTPRQYRLQSRSVRQLEGPQQ
jgi:LacI family transcriptional regulator